MVHQTHSAASDHLPFFISAPDQTDVLFVLAAVFLVMAVLAAGVFFFWLHSLPERMVHNKIQFDIVAVLALLSLFTHIHAFWVAALILALIKFPDFSLPSFSNSLDRLATSIDKLSEKPPDNSKPKPSTVSPVIRHDDMRSERHA